MSASIKPGPAQQPQQDSSGNAPETGGIMVGTERPQHPAPAPAGTEAEPEDSGTD